MALTNWPPTNFPEFPSSEWRSLQYQAANLRALIADMVERGWTRGNPTAQENQTWFKGVRCTHDDPCSGIILISPSGVRYPFAYCTGALHKELLVLWGPDYCMGGSSAIE